MSYVEFRMRAIMDAIEKIAEAGDVCPTNRELGDLCTPEPIPDVGNLLPRMRAAGWITVKHRGGKRIITIVETGQKTADPWLDTSGGVGAQAGLDDASNNPFEKYAEAENRKVKRDPCFACGIPFHKHDELGCRRWRAMG
ncbi:hypothetical protein GRI39_02060 [Altererythrobacter indicus]|uniref:Uncharacterized protein n=1 Tax=Altericroceibacterium indicum TaxID=374177 RepID=A0A845A711_9SPHN|nr:hypothetical protein [Altericroceibacterium indicum]MXP24831.1 hypothetical protein [Altericroceibacterium indicum]